MRVETSTLLIVLSGAMWHPAFATDSCPLPLELTSLLSRNPVIEAEEEAKKDKPQLMGVMGYALLLPKAPGTPYCWSHAGLVHVIHGTNDAICSSEQARLQSVAVEFAEAFNEKLLQSAPRLRKNACSKAQ